MASSNSSASSTGGRLNDRDVTRTAMRISLAAWSELERDSETMNEVELLKKYILLCPFVTQESSAVEAALKGLENLNGSGRESPVAISPDEGKPSAHVLPRSVQHSKSASNKSKFHRVFRVMGVISRTLLVETPLVFIFALYLATLWTHRVHDLYLYPQMEALKFTDERSRLEQTFYYRQCDSNDVSTSDPNNLFLPENATAEDAYQHQLLHGMTFFPGVLSEETATNLRNFVSSRNRNLKDEESIFVIENENRYSFGLGTEEPSVIQAVKQLATNEKLVTGMEKILGTNPALIEMTAITSSYGAVDQFWHHDVVSRGSVIQFGRTFSPAYSVFIQLQNTTRQMGATTACPGSHLCPFGKMKSVCEDHGFPAVRDDGYWRAGDAMLMNMNTYHRGAAHTDPDGLDRVMLILTFVPKPRTHAETRQMSQGITFSLRWDMWGHTMRDLAMADTAMSQPWATLRALGLYKERDADWGIDYVTSALMRMANQDNGFRPDELKKFIKTGGFKLLPDFLQGQVSQEGSWPEFLLDTLVRCETFLKRVALYATCVYFAFNFLMSLVLKSPSASENRIRRFGGALFRMAISYGTVFLLYQAATYHVDRTQWASDIRNKRLYSVPHHNGDTEYLGPSTLPFRNDVLIEQRYGSEYLALYNDFIEAHPGNRFWRSLLKDGGEVYKNYGGLSLAFRDAYAEFIVSQVENEAGRFLYQDRDHFWVVMSTDDAIRRTKFELELTGDPVKRMLRRQLRYLHSECKYGHIRDTAMTKKHTLPFLSLLRSKLLLMELHATPKASLVRPQTNERVVGGPKRRSAFLKRTFSVSIPRSQSRHVRRKMKLHVGTPPGEPKVGAWWQEGDLVDALFTEQNGKVAYWYMSTILWISSSGDYFVRNEAGQTTVNKKANGIRLYRPPKKGNVVEVNTGGGTYYAGKITGIVDDGLFNVYIQDLKQTLDGVSDGKLRRPGEVPKTKKKKKKSIYAS